MAGLRWSGGVLTLILAAATPAIAQQPSPAGRVKIASGSAFIVRDATIPASPGRWSSRPTPSEPVSMEASASR